jgi:hypothetical protein
MKVKEALVKTTFYDFDVAQIYDFNITPCNEGHSMTYAETCKGNLENLFARCNEITEGLKLLFPLGNFTILIENATFDNYVQFVPEVGILDNNGNLIVNFRYLKK